MFVEMYFISANGVAVTAMQLSRYSFLMLAVLIFVACRQTTTEDPYKPTHKFTSGTGELIPVNFSDTTYTDLGSYVIDTTTADGWSIKYFVKDDSTRYKDLYIVCSKGNVKATYCAEGVLELRRYFIPQFKAETGANIYFTHGCATDCSAVLVLDKDSTAEFTDYLHVVEYDIQLGQIVYVPDTMYQNEEETYELDIADIHKHRVYKLTFNGICGNVYKPVCVGRIVFSKNKVSVTVSLRKNLESYEQTKQTKTVWL